AYMLAIFDQCRSARDHVLSALQTTTYLNHVSVGVPQLNGSASNGGGILSLRQQNGETLRILRVANDCAERNRKHRTRQNLAIERERRDHAGSELIFRIGYGHLNGIHAALRIGSRRNRGYPSGECLRKHIRRDRLFLS